MESGGKEAVERSYCEGVWGKARRVRWLSDRRHRLSVPPLFVTGSWDEAADNGLTLWRLVDPSSTVDDDPLASLFRPVARHPVGADTEDIVALSEDLFLVSTGKGDVILLRVSSNGADLELSEAKVWSDIHSSNGTSSASACMSVCGSDLIVGGSNGSVRQIDLKTGRISGQNSTKLAAIHCITHVGNQQVAVGTGGGRLELLDVRVGDGGQQAAVQSAAVVGGDALTCLDAHPSDAHLLAVGSAAGAAAFVDLRHVSAANTHLLAVSAAPLWEIRFHELYPSNLFSCSDDGCLLQWDATQLKRAQHSTGMDVSQLNPWLCGEGLSNKLKLENLTPGQLLSVNSLDLATDALLCATDSQTIYLIRDLVLK